MKLRQLFEAKRKTAVLAFGRLNPPTTGHAKLVDAIKSQEGDHYLFLSHTQKPKTDPLDFATKQKFVKQFFPEINVGHQQANTPVAALEMLQGLGYTDIIFVAGSDRVEGFQKLFDTYNGKPNKSGEIPFKFNSIKVISAGERDPDADDVSGMSASKMRAAAAAGNLEAFTQGVPKPELAQTMYNAVRNGMGVKSVEPAEGVDEMAAYKGNLGLMELFAFFSKAEKEDPDLADKVKDLISKGQDKLVWKIIQDYTGTKLVGKEFEGSIAETIIAEANHGRYWCSTDKKWKYRKGPKQSRSS